MSMIGIFVGHSRKINGRHDGGAVSVGGVSEREFNIEVAETIASELVRRGVACRVYQDYQGSSYSSAMQWVADTARSINADAVVELHFNSSENPAANGHEWLHWHASSASKSLAEEIEGSFAAEFPTMKRRGMKALTSGSRGAEFVSRTHCPAVVCEPFFGSNPLDWKMAEAGKEEIGYAIAAGICDWLGVGESKPLPPPVSEPETWTAHALSCTRRHDGAFDVTLRITPGV